MRIEKDKALFRGGDLSSLFPCQANGSHFSNVHCTDKQRQGEKCTYLLGYLTGLTIFSKVLGNQKEKFPLMLLCEIEGAMLNSKLFNITI